MSNQIVVRLTTEADYDDVRPFLFGSQKDALAVRGVVFAAYDGERPCGVLGALPEEGRLRIVSLYVEENCRRKGTASALLDMAEDYAAASGMTMLHAAYSCAPEQADALAMLFTKKGFPFPQKGTTMYTIALDAVKDSRFSSLADPSPALAARIFPLDEMPKRAWAGYRKRLQNELPDYMDPAQTVGIPLPELCLTYVEGDCVRGALVVSEADGTLHLAGANLDGRQYGNALIALLKTALNTAREKYPQYDTLTITGATQAGRSLIERLFEGAAYTEAVMYTSVKPLESGNLIQPNGYGGVMMRTKTLAEELAAHGYECRVVMENGTLPYLTVPLDGTNITAVLSYTTDDADTYSEFTLEAAAAFPADVLTCGEREAVCAQINDGQEDGPAAAAENGQTAYIVFRDVHEEPSEFDEEAVLDGFALPYLQQAAKCAMLIAAEEKKHEVV